MFMKPLLTQNRKVSSTSGGLSLATEQASTSGTSIDFTGIAAGVKRITVMFDQVSGSGTSNIIVQLGDSGGIEATGYTGSTSNLSAGVATSAFTTGISVTQAIAATSVLNGLVTLTHMGGNSWTATVVMGRSDTGATNVGGYAKTLTAALTQVRITTAGGTDTFDTGVINVLVER